jgi:hypothetical protein
MNSLANLSLSDLKNAIALREEIDALQAELSSILSGAGATKVMSAPAVTGAPVVSRGRGGRRGISAAGRAAIAAAQRARWARAKGMKQAVPKLAGRRKMSAATRKAMAAAAKARWAKAKAAGRTRL